MKINEVFSQNEFSKAAVADQGQVFVGSWPLNQEVKVKAHTDFQEYFQQGNFI